MQAKQQRVRNRLKNSPEKISVLFVITSPFPEDVWRFWITGVFLNMKMKNMLLFVRAPFLISKKAVRCTWEGQSIKRWYNFPAIILLSLRFRGVATTLRNKRFRVILSPVQRQQNKVRTEGRKQSGQRQPEECARGKKQPIYAVDSLHFSSAVRAQHSQGV